MKVGWVGLAIVVWVMGSGGCGADEPERGSPQRRCEALREQVVGIQMRQVTADHGQHQAALRAALDDRFVAACLALPDATRECLRTAGDAEALAACHAN